MGAGGLSPPPSPLTLTTGIECSITKCKHFIFVFIGNQRKFHIQRQNIRITGKYVAKYREHCHDVMINSYNDGNRK